LLFFFNEWIHSFYGYNVVSLFSKRNDCNQSMQEEWGDFRFVANDEKLLFEGGLI